MTTPTPVIGTLTHGTLKLGTGASPGSIQIECWTNAATLGQTTDMQEVKTLCPSSTGSAPSTTSYTLAVTYFADEQTGGPSEWLYTHHGTLVDFEFAPFADATPLVKYTGKCWVLWGGTGGTSGELAQVDVEFPCVGKPTRTSA